jgi:GT2 family glycosyltransferase
MNDAVSVVIVNWNSAGYLTGCLQSVLDQSRPPAEVVVIDNASADASPADGRSVVHVHPNGGTVRWVMNRENVGFSRAANQGIAQSSGDWVLLLNPDVVLSVDYLDRLLAAVRERTAVGLATGKILRFDHRTIDTTGQFLRASRRIRERGYGEADTGQYDQPGEIFSVCGAVAFYRRAMLEAVAYEGEVFDEDFFAFYEDADLGWRAQLRGWRGWYEPGAVAYHARGGTNPLGHGPWGRWQMPRRPLKIQFHILANRYLMVAKNERAGGLIARAPALLWAELVDWGYVLLVQPRLLSYLSEALRLFRRAVSKRSAVAEVGS